MQQLRLLLLGLTLTVVALACAPKLVGPTSSSGYFFAVLTNSSLLLGESVVLAIRVQDAQGNPVEGVPVAFEVASRWANAASVSPTRTVTRKNGEAQTVFQADTIGAIPVTVRVDNTATEILFASATRGGVSE